jgi:myosin heavy subunit
MERYAEGGVGVEDMITLDDLSEQSMLRNIRERYARDIIYVSRALQLVSILHDVWISVASSTC